MLYFSIVKELLYDEDILTLREVERKLEEHEANILLANAGDYRGIIFP